MQTAHAAIYLLVVRRLEGRNPEELQRYLADPQTGRTRLRRDLAAPFLTEDQLKALILRPIMSTWVQMDHLLAAYTKGLSAMRGPCANYVAGMQHRRAAVLARLNADGYWGARTRRAPHNALYFALEAVEASIMQALVEILRQEAPHAALILLHDAVFVERCCPALLVSAAWGRVCNLLGWEGLRLTPRDPPLALQRVAQHDHAHPHILAHGGNYRKRPAEGAAPARSTPRPVRQRRAGCPP